jgi:hypothetical protein
MVLQLLQKGYTLTVLLNVESVDDNGSNMDILPIELIPLILGQLPSPQDLSVTCRINRVFWRLSVPLLYEKVYIQAWHRQSKRRVCTL